ncbi:hypothetical protein MKX01_020475 [Papaver californicum]|nr:hypothetical protein MKX01_020475 [Papaver californicum]
MSGTTKTPLLEYEEVVDQEKPRGCWSKFLDVKEAKSQVSFLVPMIITNVFYYSITLISVMFVGHLGEVELVGATLANSWATVTGLALMTGLSRALKTLCGQGYGAKLYKMLGIYFYWMGLGIRGAALSAAISLWISFLMLALYYWAFEILVLLAGLMPHSENSTSLIAVVNTEAVTFMITYGFSAAVSTRVSNELGAGNADGVKNVVAVTLKLSVLLALMVIVSLLFGHDLWASAFSDIPDIRREFANMTPLLAISILFDSAQGVLSGVSRGCGWQHLAAWTNLGAFYIVGMPIAVLLAFKFAFYAKGLWLGLIYGLSTQASILLVITLRIKWLALQLSVTNEKHTTVLV